MFSEYKSSNCLETAKQASLVCYSCVTREQDFEGTLERRKSQSLTEKYPFEVLKAGAVTVTGPLQQESLSTQTLGVLPHRSKINSSVLTAQVVLYCPLADFKGCP